ncbi:MAG: phage holin family protein [Myxococcota bacterium]
MTETTTQFLAHLIVSAALLVLVASAVPGIKLTGPLAALLGALVLGFVNALVRPLVVLLTLPITVITFGLFLLIVNAAMLKLAAVVVPGFRIRGWWPAILGAVLLTVLNLLIDAWLGPGW